MNATDTMDENDVHRIFVLRIFGFHRKRLGIRLALHLPYRQHVTTSKGPRRPLTASFSLSLNRMKDAIRYDRQDHLLIPTPDKKDNIS